MTHKIRHRHFAGIGAADTNREQGSRAAGCDRPRVAPAAGSGALGRMTA